MRKVLTMAALLALMATPAFAKSRVVSQPFNEAPVYLGASEGPWGQLAVRGATVMGQDPDAHVRFELGRDNPTY